MRRLKSEFQEKFTFFINNWFLKNFSEFQKMNLENNFKKVNFKKVNFKK